MKIFENLAIALLLGICGFFSGVLVWGALSFTPGLDIPLTTYFHLSIVLAIIFFVFGLFQSKRAVDFLGEIIGEVTSEDVLNNIFSKFCIGK